MGSRGSRSERTFTSGRRRSALVEAGLSGPTDVEGAPAPDLYQGALFAGEAHLRKREWFAASRAFERASRLAVEPEDRELARALVHLAAAGYKKMTGDGRGAERQRSHAQRRLEPFLPEAWRLDLEALVALVDGGD